METFTASLLLGLSLLTFISLIWLITLVQKRVNETNALTCLINELKHHLTEQLHANQLQQLQQLQENMQKGLQMITTQVNAGMKSHSDVLSTHMSQLTKTTDSRLQSITSQVEERLSKGFEKTSATFTEVIKRLALIDQAQLKMTELSNHVINLESILKDKSSRGTLGEVQLASIIRNMMPEQHFKLQHTLSNGKRVDCLLYLPDPTGNLSIDAKFPLETYRKITCLDENSMELKSTQQQFRIDIKRHIDAISNKYIIPGETAEGALMFIPAEAIFAQIHSHYGDLVEYAQTRHVWIVSPTTMMAIITTANAVIKDLQTRKQVHIIQEHLSFLAKDFGRFEKRMEKLAKHIDMAHDDVSGVNKSARKLTQRFSKIEKVELAELENDDTPLEQLLMTEEE